MPVTVTLNPLLQVSETVALGLDKVTDPSVTHTIAGGQTTLNATSTPPATVVFSDRITLSAGAAALDLTALARGNLPALDMTGLKVQCVKVTADTANTDRVLVEDGATNGYPIAGVAANGISLGAGETVLLLFNESLGDVSGTVKSIDLTSADVDAIVEILIVAG